MKNKTPDVARCYFSGGHLVAVDENRDRYVVAKGYGPGELRRLLKPLGYRLDCRSPVVEFVK